MGIELLNLSQETKSYLSKLTRAIEELAAKEEKKFVETKTDEGKAFVRISDISAITYDEDSNRVAIILNNGNNATINMSYEDACKLVS